jgi:hypothetical protein
VVVISQLLVLIQQRWQPAFRAILTAWLIDWPVVRDEVEKLLDTYLQSKPDYDRRRTEGPSRHLPRALAELAYDAGWLEAKLE